MKNKGFSGLVERGLRERVVFEGARRLPQSATRWDIMMLQLVLRAVQGDSKALRRILKILKDTKPAPGRTSFRVFELGEHGMVVESRGWEKIVVGPLSDFPNLPESHGPMQIPKEWLKQASAKKRRKQSAKEPLPSDEDPGK